MDRSELLEFTYAWPQEAAAIPLLAKRLEEELLERRREAERDAREDRATRGKDAPFFAHSFDKQWTVAGSTGQLLSLRATTEFYTGGAHPNMLFDAVIWDRQAARALTLADWFTAPEEAIARVETLYCRALDSERLERRGGEIGAPGTWETKCPALKAQVVVPQDGDGDGRFERIVIMLPPYEAGPYAEGAYVVVLAADPRLVAALKPEYRASFGGAPADD
mgnify:CR=1 FL=1